MRADWLRKAAEDFQRLVVARRVRQDLAVAVPVVHHPLSGHCHELDSAAHRWRRFLLAGGTWAVVRSRARRPQVDKEQVPRLVRCHTQVDCCRQLAVPRTREVAVRWGRMRCYRICILARAVGGGAVSSDRKPADPPTGSRSHLVPWRSFSARATSRAWNSASKPARP